MFGVYPYQNNTIYINEEVVSVLVGLLATVLAFVLVIRLALFIFRSVSLYKIARRRGIRNAWLAWVPVGSDWVLGNVADQYQYVVKGKIRNRRLPLLLLTLAVLVLQAVVSAMGFNSMLDMVRVAMTGSGYPDVVRIVLLAMITMVQSGVAIALLVVRGFALYDFYSSCTSRYNVLFLVLGLVFRFLEPVFFFVCRNKEEGMPPRREEHVFREPEVAVEE